MFRIPQPFSRRGALVLARGLINLLGGILIGVGLFLWGQALFVEYVKAEVDNTFFLLRWVGKISFIFMRVDNKLFLSISEIPDEAIVESVRWAKGLLISGGCIALFSLFLQPPPEKGKGKGKKRR
jgi:hypothetical protein